MFAQYLRIIFIILALIGGVLLFAFAFTTAAIIVGVLLIIGLIFGRGKTGSWVVVRRSGNPFDQSQPPRHGPITIDHDPNDLPPNDGGTRE
jgi:disulfide bond formation protein DsbB